MVLGGAVTTRLGTPWNMDSYMIPYLNQTRKEGTTFRYTHAG